MNSLRSLRKSDEIFSNLLKIQKLVPGSIIAGGFLRDLYHNKPINDIDLYVPNYVIDEVNTIPFWEDVFNLDEDTFDSINSGTSSEAHYAALPNISHTLEVDTGSYLYNIIILDTPPINYVNESFDFGICKIYCDGIKIRLGADFIKDSAQKVLRVANKKLTDDQFNIMMYGHYTRLKRKFPDFTLDLPNEYKPLYDKLDLPC